MNDAGVKICARGGGESVVKVLDRVTHRRVEIVEGRACEADGEGTTTIPSRSELKMARLVAGG